MKLRTRRSARILHIVAVLPFLPVATAHWAAPSTAPVARLVANLTAYVEEHPEDPHGYFLLGRVHGLAFALKSRTVCYWKEDARGLPDITKDQFQNVISRRSRGDASSQPTFAELLMHAGEAVRNLERAVELNRDSALYRLSLASVLEDGTELDGRADVLPKIDGSSPSTQPTKEDRRLIRQLGDRDPEVRVKAEADARERLDALGLLLYAARDDTNVEIKRAARKLLREYWRDRALEQYFVAHQRSIDQDMKWEEQPITGLGSLISYEAGTAYVRLMKARGVKDETEQKQLDLVEKNVKRLEDIPPCRAITPIIFSLHANRPLGDLLADNSAVQFDLDGDDRVESWPWVRPDTGILVWDPEHSGRITSGRQLFGNATWWMFFRNGYEALSALDDDRDGWLRGRELTGLSVWHDRNSNGLSERGEVTPVEAAGIECIATEPQTWEGRSPAHPFGLRMRGGQMRPTYDWVTDPREKQRERPGRPRS